MALNLPAWPGAGAGAGEEGRLVQGGMNHPVVIHVSGWAVSKPVSANGHHCQAPRHRSPGHREVQLTWLGAPPGQLGDKGAGARAPASAHSRGRREGAPAAGCLGRAPHPGPVRGAVPGLTCTARVKKMPASDASFFMLKSMARPSAGPPRRPQSSRQPPRPAARTLLAPRPPAACARPLRAHVSELAERGAGPARAGTDGEGRSLAGALLPPAGRRQHQPAVHSHEHLTWSVRMHCNI